MTEYYDVVLGVIPVSLIGIAVILSTLGIPLTAAIPVGAAVSVGVIGHAMFVNGPVDSVVHAEAERNRAASESIEAEPSSRSTPSVNAE